MAPSSVTERIAQTAQFLQSTVLGVQIPNQIPWSPDSKSFPSRKDLPKLPGAPEGAAWVWGEEDYVCICTDYSISIGRRHILVIHETDTNRTDWTTKSPHTKTCQGSCIIRDSDGRDHST